MVNYENGKIYKIVCNVTGLCYVGSTCEPTLARRLAEHVKKYKQYKNGKTNYVTSFKIIENDDYDIILLENVKNCTSKEELHARERYYIENNECVNRIVVGRTKKESRKAYYATNKEIICKKSQQYREANKEYYKEYYEKNKEIICEKKKEKHNCPCGGHFRTSDKGRHMKSIKHKSYVQLETLKECLTKKLSFSETKKIMEAL